MSNPPLKRIEELFHRAVELDPEERRAFLQTECAGNADLKAAVEALLKHDQDEENATEVLASPIQRSPESPDTAVPIRPDAADQLLPRGELPQGIPGYEVLEELGRGGMGVVYKARQTGLNRLVALKMLAAIVPVTAEDLARFRIEVESLARLHHPNIVQIYEIGEHEGLPYFVMEYIDGPDLAQQTGSTPQPPLIAAHLVEILARAIAAVHQCGIIHRDLKPANVLLHRKSEVQNPKFEKEDNRTFSNFGFRISDFQPKITDFGLAKQIEGPGAGTLVGSVIGTPCYMPPEQVRGEIGRLGPWTDLYALGAILYELLTGRPPIQEANPAAALTKVLTEDPLLPSRWRSGLSRDLDTICLKCLEKDPERRYASANDLAEDLRRYQAGEPIKARPIGMVERLWRWAKRQPLAASALAAAVILAFTLIGTVLAYDARLRQALVKEEKLAEDRRLQLVQFDISISLRELNEGDAFRALLWLTEAMKRDQDNPDHRQRIVNILEQVPWLAKVAICPGSVLASRWIKDECWLAIAAKDHTVQIWDVRSEKPIGPDLHHNRPVILAEFAPDGKYLATASGDGAVRLWHLQSGRFTDLLMPEGRTIEHLIFDAGGHFLLVQSAKFEAWCYSVAAEKGDPLHFTVAASGQIALISPNGRFIFAVDSSGLTKLWNVIDGKTTTAQVKLEAGPMRGALAHDGQLAAVLDSKNSISIIESATGKVRGRPLGHSRPVKQIEFTATGEHLVTVDIEQATWLWPSTGEDRPLLTIAGPRRTSDHAGGTTHHSPAGSYLAILGNDERLRIWDAITQKPIVPPLQRPSALEHEAFSAGGKRLIVVDTDHTVRLWDLSPCANRAAHVVSGPGIQPGMTRDFTLPRIAALAEVLAGASIDQEERLTPLTGQDLLAAWQRFEN
jgi:eukaryotic-like serine/threonine-protein kinase